MGLKFRRQHPIDRFIVDFYCHEQSLIIEVDGGIHNTQINREYDQDRTIALEKSGLRVIRFSNEQVTNNLSETLTAIVTYLTSSQK